MKKFCFRSFVLCLILIMVFPSMVACTPIAEEIVLENKTIVLDVGEKYNIKYNILPEKASENPVYWSSSNDSIATVDNGTVTAIKEGECKISVKVDEIVSDVTCKVELSIDQLKASGRYSEAIKKATAEEEKMDIFTESSVAYVTKNLLYEFEIILQHRIDDAWLHVTRDADTKKILGFYVITYCKSELSTGETGSLYWVYGNKSLDAQYWEYVSVVTDTVLSDDDDYDEMVAKLAIVLAKENGTRLSTNQVNNINKLIENEKITDIKHIEKADINDEMLKKISKET